MTLIDITKGSANVLFANIVGAECQMQHPPTAKSQNACRRRNTGTSAVLHDVRNTGTSAVLHDVVGNKLAQEKPPQDKKEKELRKENKCLNILMEKKLQKQFLLM